MVKIKSKLEEKIAALENEIRLTPYNKASEAHVGRLKAKLAKLRETAEKNKSKKSKRAPGIKKSGDAMVILTGSAESRIALLSRFFGSQLEKDKYADKQVLMLKHKGADIQIVNLPADEAKAIITSADLVLDAIAFLESYSFLSDEELRDKIFEKLHLIRIFTKEPGKKADMNEPLVLKKGAVLKDVCLSLHKHMLKNFLYGKIWSSSAKFPGQRVGSGHKLNDGDIVEIHFKS